MRNGLVEGSAGVVAELAAIFQQLMNVYFGKIGHQHYRVILC